MLLTVETRSICTPTFCRYALSRVARSFKFHRVKRISTKLGNADSGYMDKFRFEDQMAAKVTLAIPRRKSL